jgi:hypothetical protein
MITRSILVAGAVLIASAAGAFAQGSHDAGAGSVSPIIPPGSTATATPADKNPQVPGATGSAKVPGDASTMSGDRKATIEQRTGTGTAASGGGSN